MSFYIIEQAETILITDDCNTLFHFHTQGLHEGDRAIRSLRDRLACTASSVGMETDGEILLIGPKSSASVLVADYVSALCALMHYEREIIGLSKETVDFAAEVEAFLRATRPEATITSKPKIIGNSGHEYCFDLAVDDTLVLAIEPKPQSVGSAMRKTADVALSSGMEDKKLLIIVDDRKDNAKAKTEMTILSSIAPVAAYSTLFSQVPFEAPMLN